MNALGGKPGAIHDLRDDTFCWVGKPGSHHYFYNDLPEDEAKRWSDLLRPSSWHAIRGESADAAYMDVPSGYLYCTNDNAFPYEMQKRLIGGAVEAGAQFVLTDTMDSSHSPFLSMPERAADFVRRVARREYRARELVNVGLVRSS